MTVLDEDLELNIKEDGEFIVVTGLMVHVVYKKWKTDDYIIRHHAVVDNIQFEQHPYDSYWKKIGQGGFKDRDNIIKLMRTIDKLVHRKHYSLTHTRYKV